LLVRAALFSKMNIRFQRFITFPWSEHEGPIDRNVWCLLGCSGIVT
jgi:hypothetical protein